MCKFAEEKLPEVIPEIMGFPVQDTFNEDDMSIITERNNEDVSNENN